MILRLKKHLPALVTLNSFALFPEYFISISLIYILIVVVLSSYNVYGLIIQQCLSECIAVILLLTCCLIINNDTSVLNFTNFNNSILNDYFAFLAKNFICLFSAVYLLIISNFFKEQKLVSFEYLLIILFSILGFLVMCCSNDLLIAYLSMELSSLAFYILAAFRKTSTYSIESGVKYFIIGAISSSLFLLGSSFIYGCTGSINFLDFQDLLNLSFPCLDLNCFLNKWQILHYNTSEKELFNFHFIEFGILLIIFSLFIKLSVAPFHLWSLDVYEGSPTNSTFFFATISKLSIFVLLARLCYQSFFHFKDCWQLYLLLSGLSSVFIGSFGGLKQRKLKTLLAYSGISHIGYALISFSTYSFVGFQMFLFYMLIYMLSNLGIWYILLLLRVKRKKFEEKYNKELSDLALLKKSNIILAFSFSIIMFSIAGIPPLIGFLAKMHILLAVIGVSFHFLAFFIIFCSVISTFYYIRIIKISYFENILVGKLYYPIHTIKVLILSVIILLLFYLFINPTLLYLMTYKVNLHVLPKIKIFMSLNS